MLNLESMRARRRFAVIVALAVGAALFAATGCGGGKEEGEPEMVVAADGETMVETGGNYADSDLEPTEGSTTRGYAMFVEQDGEIALELDVESAPPGTHAVHIHEFGDCSAPDGTSAGSHWNPASVDHGAWGSDPFHLGDIGNLEVDENGRGRITMSTDLWAIGTGGDNDVVGKSVIVHAEADDFGQPTGNAGGRIACGVIGKK